jgi:hypothetical protein
MRQFSYITSCYINFIPFTQFVFTTDCHIVSTSMRHSVFLYYRLSHNFDSNKTVFLYYRMSHNFHSTESYDTFLGHDLSLKCDRSSFKLSSRKRSTSHFFGPVWLISRKVTFTWTACIPPPFFYSAVQPFVARKSRFIDSQRRTLWVWAPGHVMWHHCALLLYF